MVQTLRLLFTLGVRNIARNPRRTLLMILAITVGIVSANMLTALQRGMGEQLVHDSIMRLTGHLQVRAEGYREDPAVEFSFVPDASLLTALENREIAHWTRRVRVPAVIMSERESRGVELVGIDALREQEASSFGQMPEVGGSLNDPSSSGIVIGKKLAEELDTAPGKRIVLMSQKFESGKTAERGFRVLGVFDAELDSSELAYVFTRIEVAQEMLELGQRVSETTVLLKERRAAPEWRERLAAIEPQLEVTTWRELEPLVVAMVEIQDGVQYLWYVIVMTTVAFGLVNTLFMAIFERTRELGLYQALGMKQSSVVVQILCESMVLLLLGAVSGNAMSLLLLEYFSSGINLAAFSEGMQHIGIQSMVYPLLPGSDLLRVNILVFLIGLLSSIYPAWKASRVNPARALTMG